MLLALRGWGPDHFRLASRELLQGVRWALFAEGAVNLLATARQAAATPVPPRSDLAVFGEAMRLRADGAREVERLSAVLFPEDGDGG